jgi:hypothetical protein
MFYVMVDDTKFEKDLNVENKRNMETMIRTMMRAYSFDLTNRCDCYIPLGSSWLLNIYDA